MEFDTFKSRTMGIVALGRCSEWSISDCAGKKHIYHKREQQGRRARACRDAFTARLGKYTCLLQQAVPYGAGCSGVEQLFSRLQIGKIQAT